MTADAHARARALGPLRLGPGVPAPAGMTRLTGPDSTGLALPVWPDGATPALLEEHQVAPMPVERAGETRRVLAAVLKCCWTDLSADPWPGEPAPLERVLDTYRALIGRTDDLMRNWAIGALRRLHDSAWAVLSDGIVSLGPRCALWPVESHAVLKDLVRRIPEPERRAAPVVPDATLVAAALPDRNAASPVSDATPGTAALPERALTASDGTTRATPPEHGATAGTAALPERSGGPAVSDTMPVTAAFPGRRDAPVVAEAAPVALSSPESGAAGDPAAPAVPHPGSRAEPGVAEFDDLLSGYDERRRAELVSAFMVVEHAAEPVPEARFAALRDPALRRTLAEMLARRGRTLIQQRDRWTSGYADDLVRDEQPDGGPGESERAVLTLVLVHSVAIPRAEGLLPEDSWLSPHPTPVDELRRHTQLPIGELESALRALRHAGLLTQVKAGEEAGGYVPGPQFHRLTPAARRRLQEELILAAGPDTPLAAAVRARRAAR